MDYDQQIPPGYKQTEVGVIPEDWEVIALVRLADIRSGIAKNMNIKINNPIEVHYLRVANVQDGFLDLSEFSKLKISRSDVKRYEVLPGDVLMNEGGDLDKLGRGAIWGGEFNLCVHQNHVFVVRCSIRLLPEYLNIWTSSISSRRYFVVTGKQTTNLASINKTALGLLPIALPKKNEQQAIAEVLSDADALIESLEQLITKKRKIKQGSMQELLTGKKRLPGFGGEWKIKCLGDVAEIDSESIGSKTSPHYRFGYISLEDVNAGILCDYSEEVFSTAPSRARRKIKKGDILVSTVRPNLKSHLLFDFSTPNWICSTGFSVIRCLPGVTNAQFIFANLFGYIVEQQIDTLLTGSNYPAINSRDIKSLIIPLPEYTEQTAIAAILSDMDAEIDVLEAKLAKARQIKQGMMQELLTGRIRLVNSAKQRQPENTGK